MLLNPLSLLGLAALLQQVQQAPAQSAQSPFRGATSPPSGDTIRYWQQRVQYTITATLDEEQAKLRADGVLVYVNNSPDTLREMYFHQYLNAFRPNSKWSKADARENVVRFQNLREPNYGYERFTEAPTVDGVPVIIDYPGAPDSTVVHFRLLRPLAPHDSVRVHLAWDARPSTVTRRQGRRGRTWDFAQWYPKVAVYDRGGWEPNPFIPAGELYGEFGTYDVTMIVRDDQIIASTGVPVSGDPGWARVSRSGTPYTAANAYRRQGVGDNVGQRTRDAGLQTVPAGYRAVRFVARDVHMFAWSASPDYVYEGATYVREVPHQHFPTWDTVAVNVLYKPGDDSTWGHGIAVTRTIAALRWLESFWGPYGYPQITSVHRLDPGGTEFPMMIMLGGDSQGLILHELGHVYTYGILANNEWRSGWLDEGLTDFQTQWAQGLTAPERAKNPPPPPRIVQGYRANAVTIPPAQTANLGEIELELLGRTQPIGTPAYDFHEFGIYNEMIYTRATLMYSQLRDVLGDSAFFRFTHDYYQRWAFKHVDERAIRASAERAYGRPLGWFFDQWVHGTGLMDYALGPYSINTDGTHWQVLARTERVGELRHPMPLGVQTANGWSIGRADPLLDAQNVSVTTDARPVQVMLDPEHVTFDWDWRNNTPETVLLGVVQAPRFTFNWPWLTQSDRSHTIVALAPTAWYSDPQGGVVGIRVKTNYLSMVDEYDAGLAVSSRSPINALGQKPNIATRANVWLRGENLYLPGMSRPAMGIGGGVNYLDGLLKLDLYKKWDLSPFLFTPGPSIGAQVYATAAMPSDSMLLPEQWANVKVLEVGGSGVYKTMVYADSEYAVAHASAAGGFAAASDADPLERNRAYFRGDASVGVVRSLVGTETQLHARLYGGVARGAPRQREIFASTEDPFQTFTNDLFRPRGALFKRPGINYLPLGGAGLRGFGFDTPLDGVGAVNGEVVQHLSNFRGSWGHASVAFSVFGDAALASSRYLALTSSTLADAGAGLIVGGRLYDRNFYVRLDAPVLVNQTGIAGGRGLGGNGSLAPRWTVTVGNLWQ